MYWPRLFNLFSIPKRALFTSRDDITIPVKKEDVGEVTITPYVKEEVVVKKKPVTETKEVTENITSEIISNSNV